MGIEHSPQFVHVDEIALTKVGYCSIQGIIDMNRNGNSANFFSYVCNGKKVKSCLPLF